MSSDFASLLNGRFRGMLHWADLDALWQKLREQPEGWYVSLIGEPPSPAPMTAEALRNFIGEIDALLRREHELDYCGIVFADDADAPAIVKIYDPHNLGSACNTSGIRIPPRWVLSRVPPTLIEDAAPLPGNRRRWWQKLFG